MKSKLFYSMHAIIKHIYKKIITHIIECKIAILLLFINVLNIKTRTMSKNVTYNYTHFDTVLKL